MTLEAPKLKLKRKRKSSVSAMSRTLALLREEGWTCEKTERWNPHAHVRQDLFGFIDVLAFRKYDLSCALRENKVETQLAFDGIGLPPAGHPLWVQERPELLAIQVTLGQGDVSKHVTKLQASPLACRWVSAGFPIEIWSWAKRNNRTRGARKLWTVNRIPVTREMLEGATT